MEVLFGPQSILYASTSPGGIVNVITADPKLDTYEASGLVEYGNYELLKSEGSINVPMGDAIALRGAFSTTSRGGYLTNDGVDEDSESARLKAKYAPGDSFSLVLAGELTKEGGQGFADVVEFDDQDDVEDPWTATSDTPGNVNEKERKKVYANMDTEVRDFGTLTVIGSYSETTNSRRGVGAPGGPPPPPGVVQVEQLSVEEGSGSEKGIEARLASSEASPFKWIVGVNC